MIPSIYLNVIEASTSVVVNADQTIYTTTVTGAGTHLDMDISGLDLSYREANWKWKINFTDTNALSPIFGSMFDWDGFSPDFTVTGEYVFACSAGVGYGGKIRIKQVYPSYFGYSPATFSTINQNYQATINRYVIMLSASVSNAYTTISGGDPRDYNLMMCEYLSPIDLTGAYATMGVGYTAQPAIPKGSYTNAVVVASVLSSPKKLYFVAEPFGTAIPLYYLTVFAAGFPSGNVVFRNPMVRKLTELELRYYNAGGRDFR
jgi:hypothetical protein